MHLSIHAGTHLQLPLKLLEGWRSNNVVKKYISYQKNLVSRSSFQYDKICLSNFFFPFIHIISNEAPLLVILPQNGLCPLIIPHIIWLPDISPSLSTWGKILYFNNLIKVPDLKYIKKQQQQKQTNRKTKNLWTVFLGSFEHWMTLYTIHILGQRRPCFPLPFHMMQYVSTGCLPLSVSTIYDIFYLFIYTETALRFQHLLKRKKKSSLYKL